MTSHPASTPRAKRALAAALKDALRTTPLAKVTVSGLASAVGVTRQTFYLYFSDVYDLAAWVFTTEIADHIMAHASYAEWADGCRRLLVYLKRNRDQTYAVIRSLRHAELERFLHQSLRAMMAVIVGELEGDLKLAPDDRDFVIDHYTLAVVGHVMHWLATDMTQDPRVLVGRIEFVLRGSVRESLERFAAQRTVKR
jgi:probable dihydroxyacetone kinase regulator